MYNVTPSKESLGVNFPLGAPTRYLYLAGAAGPNAFGDEYLEKVLFSMPRAFPLFVSNLRYGNAPLGMRGCLNHEPKKVGGYPRLDVAAGRIVPDSYSDYFSAYVSGIKPRSHSEYEFAEKIVTFWGTHRLTGNLAVLPTLAGSIRACKSFMSPDHPRFSVVTLAAHLAGHDPSKFIEALMRLSEWLPSYLRESVCVVTGLTVQGKDTDNFVPMASINDLAKAVEDYGFSFGLYFRAYGSPLTEVRTAQLARAAAVLN